MIRIILDPHKWRTHVDQGQGTLNINVYPVHIKFDSKQFFYERNDEVVGREETVTCFADHEASPPEEVTTLDSNLHRAARREYHGRRIAAFLE